MKTGAPDKGNETLLRLVAQRYNLQAMEGREQRKMVRSDDVMDF